MVLNPALNSPCCECEEQEHLVDASSSSVYLVTDNTSSALDLNRVRSPKGIIWLEGTVSVTF